MHMQEDKTFQACVLAKQRDYAGPKTVNAIGESTEWPSSGICFKSIIQVSADLFSFRSNELQVRYSGPQSVVRVKKWYQNSVLV